MDVVLASTRMTTRTRVPSCNIRFPRPLKFGIDGKPVPPRSNFVGFAIFSSVSQLGFTREGPYHCHFVIRKTFVPDFPDHLRRFFMLLQLLFHPSRVTSPPSCQSLPGVRNGAFRTHATLPQYLVVFSLDTTGLPRHNVRHY